MNRDHNQMSVTRVNENMVKKCLKELIVTTYTNEMHISFQ